MYYTNILNVFAYDLLCYPIMGKLYDQDPYHPEYASKASALSQTV